MSTRGTLWYFSTMIKSARWLPFLTLHKYHDVIDDGIYFEVSIDALNGLEIGRNLYKEWTFKIGEYDRPKYEEPEPTTFEESHPDIANHKPIERVKVPSLKLKKAGIGRAEFHIDGECVAETYIDPDFLDMMFESDIIDLFEDGISFARTEKGKEYIKLLERKEAEQEKISKKETHQEHIWDSLKDDLKEAGL